MSQIKKKFITDDAVADEKIRLDNTGYLRSRNAANDGDLNLLRADSSDIVDMPQPDHSIGGEGLLISDAVSSNWWGGDVPGVHADTGTNSLGAIAFRGKDVTTDVTSIDILIETGANTFATTAGYKTGSIYYHSGPVTAGSGNSGNIEMTTGDAVSGQSGNVDIYSGSAPSGNTGYVSLQTSLGSTADNRGDLRLQGRRIDILAGPLRPQNLAADPTILTTYLAGDTYYNTVSNKMRFYTGSVWADVGGGATITPKKETFTLVAGDITNQYLDLTEEAKVDSITFIVKGGGPLLEGASHDYSVSYTGGVGSKTRITFLNDIATGGAAALIATDVVQIKYAY